MVLSTEALKSTKTDKMLLKIFLYNLFLVLLGTKFSSLDFDMGAPHNKNECGAVFENNSFLF